MVISFAASPLVVADTATTVTAAFAAVAAGAAWVTVLTEWLRQRRARAPNVSAGFQTFATPQQRIEFVNMGPGLAIQLTYLLNVGGSGDQRVGSLVGGGHLRAGERVTVDLPMSVPGKTADFIWACRDIDQRLHVWSYAGRHQRLKRGEYPNAGELFRRMYPNVPLPPRGVGMDEESTTPGE